MAQIALVTGAAKRIGRAIAVDLARHGWIVAVHYNGSDEDAQSTLSEIDAVGGQAHVFPADFTNENETADLVAQVNTAIGPVDCLINNASVFEYDSVQSTTRQSWDFHMEVNLRAPFVLSQAFAAQISDDRHGAIINIIDQRVWNLTQHFTSYTVSKVGLWTLTQTLALALAPNIRVNGIGPGPTLPSPRQSEEQFERQWRALPLQRPTEPAEICQAVRFILSTPSLTGQMLALDGGQHLGPVGSPSPQNFTE